MPSSNERLEKLFSAEAPVSVIHDRLTMAARRWAAPILSAVVALIVYAVTLGGTFIYDDVVDVHDDPRVKLVRLWPTYFTTSYNGGVDNLFRPLVSLSFAVQWWISGAGAVGERSATAMHCVNWLLHAAVCALVAMLAGRLYRNAAVATVAGCLFAVLPIHVEAVTALVGRAELMCAAGVVGALVILLRSPLTLLRVFAACGCLVLAVGSKEQGLLLPLLAAVMALCLGIRRPKDEPERQAMLFAIAAGCLLTAGYVVYRESILTFMWDRSFLDWTEQPMIRCRGADKLLVPLAILGRYASLIVWPAKLSIDYGGHFVGWHVEGNDPRLWIGIGIVIAWLVAALTAWRWRSGPTLFCVLAMALLYGMVGNFPIIIGTNFAERLMYLPTVFLCVLAGRWIARLPRSPMIVLAALLVLVGGVRSFTYARQWNDRLRFYQTQSIERPQSVRLHMLVADEEGKRGDLDAAAEADRLGREAEPDYFDIWIQSGDVAMKQKKFEQAEQFLTRAVALQPMVSTAWLGKLRRLRAATQQMEAQRLEKQQPATLP